MADGLLSYVQRVADPVIKQALRLFSDRLAALETLFRDLDGRVLKTGSPVEAYGQRIKDLADPQRGTDAVNLQTLRRYVQTTLQVERGVPARPTKDAGAPATYPAPVGTFTATPSSLAAPGNVTFDWTTQYADTVESSLHGALALSGSIVAPVTTSFTTTLTLRGPGGVTTYQLTVTVAATPPATPAPTGTFLAIPSTVAPGQASTLSWTSLNATAASISPGIGTVTPLAAGNITVQPAQTTQYELRLTGAGGTQILQTTVTVATQPPPPPPPPPGTTTMTAGVLGWGFSNNGQRFLWKGFTAFTLLFDALTPANAAEAIRTLQYFQYQGCTVPRILLTITDANNTTGFWYPKGYRLYQPEFPSYWTGLRDLVRYCNSLGMMPELVIFGDASAGGYGTQTDRTTFAKEVARQLLDLRGCFIQVANESRNIGFTSVGQLVEIADAYRTVDPNRIITLSGPDGGADNDDTYGVAPSVYRTVHIDRVQTPFPYSWLIRHYGNRTIMNGTQPAVSDEPINAGYAAYGAHEPDHQYWWAFGVMGRLMGWSGTFHYESGLFGYAPGAGQADELCLRAWIFGQNYPSPDQGGTLFAALPSGVAFGPCPWPNSGANTGLLGRTTAQGTAYAMTFGAAPLPAVSTGWGAVRGDAFTQGVLVPVGFPNVAFSQIRGYNVDPIGF